MLPTIGPGPNDRHLHDDVVKLLGPQPRKTGHLRAALDLEQPDRVGLLQRVINRGVVLRKMRQIDLLAVMIAYQRQSDSSIAAIIPSPSRSTLMMPISAQSSLSH